MSKEHGKRVFAWNNLIAGVAVVLPIVGTVLIVNILLGLWNRYLLDPVLTLITPCITLLLPGIDVDRVLIAAILKVFIFILIIFGFVMIGILAKNLIIRRLLAVGEGIVLRLPFINKIYKLVRQISSAFFGERKELFNKVVLVEYPRKGCYIIALMTSSCRGEVAQRLGKNFVNVFVPTTPNPTSGYLIMVPRSDVKELSLTVEDAMKVIVSGGVVSPDDIDTLAADTPERGD